MLPTDRRDVYMVLSPRSLPYARLGLASLLSNSSEPLNLHLITDSQEDKQVLIRELEALAGPHQHRCDVTAESDLLDREAQVFARYPNLRSFRRGHPCWRKITDPMLLSSPGAELVLLDPDLYFPNRFCFEPTPPKGLLLMWQKPNCLLPPEVVDKAIAAKIPLSDHVDIGVSHWRAGGDLEWLDWLIGELGGASLPRVMHIEAIVWAAVAMREGGGYLSPRFWNCWHRSQARRIRRKLGASGVSILREEPWTEIKCFHAGGEAKWWLPEAKARGMLDINGSVLTQSEILPFVEMTPAAYAREQNAKNWLRRFGYYRLMG